MRVAKLLVINLSDSFDTTVRTEDRDAARALYDKHMGREAHRPTAGYLVEVKSTAETGASATGDGPLVLDRDYRVVLGGPLPATIDDPDTGVYLVFHARGSSDPNIFGVQSLTPAAKKSDQAHRLAGVLTKLGIKKIRKVCLVACNATNHKTAASKNFLVSFAKELLKWPREARPLIAGYDHVVYVKNDGTKSLDAGGSLPMKGSGHKQVWVVKGLLLSNYDRVDLADSGWSDKSVEETNVGVAAVI